MNILAPNLQWIGGRCYRINPTRDEPEGVYEAENAEPAEANAQYIEEDLYGDEDSELADGYEIVLTESNRFKTSFHVPKSFYGMIIGAKGTTRKRIESETKTSIKVPSPGADGDIEVMGALRQNVASARRRIDLIVIGARAKQSPTHFICIPVVHANVRERFVKFKEEIMAGPSVFGLDESMFQNPNKLHLTFGVLALMDSNDVRLSTQLLSECQTSIIRPVMQKFGSLDFRMTGIDHMTDDPSEIHVLYGNVESEAIQLIADEIVECFVKHGLMRREREHVKLHVTLINTRFRNNSGDYYGENDGDQISKTASTSLAVSKKGPSFDGRDILRKYAAYDFGKQPVSEVHISRRFTTNCVGGFYDASAVAKVY